MLTVCGIVLAVIVVIALVYNIVTLANLNARKAEIERNMDDLRQVVVENQEMIEYRGSDDYIRRYARDYLNMMGRYDTAYSTEQV